MKCCGCGSHVSEYSRHLETEPGQYWHPNCWVRIDWHIHHDDLRKNPRPMTTAEKVAYIEAHVRVIA